MNNLTKEDLMTVNGGSTALYIIGLGLAAVGTFVASVIYGYIYPNKCNN